MSAELIIEGVLAYHLVGTKTLPLTPQPSTLRLLSAPSLTLTIGDLAWPLGPKTIFGTQSGNLRGYFLKPDLADEASGWIKIELPESSPKLDALLVSHGMLSGGNTSGDDLAATLKDKAAQLSAVIDSNISSLKSGSQTSTPASFSPTTHSAFDSLASGSAAAASIVSSAAGALFSLSATAGSAIGSAMGLKGDPVPEGEKSDMRREVEAAFGEVKQVATDAGAGIADASSTIYNKTTTATQDAISNQQGDEAAHLSGKAGETAGNVGLMAKDTFVGTSVVEHARVAGVGAVTKE